LLPEVDEDADGGDVLLCVAPLDTIEAMTRRRLGPRANADESTRGLLPEADEDAVGDILLCVALALIEDVAVGEDLLCEALADTEDVPVGDDLLPEADEDAVGDV